MAGLQKNSGVRNASDAMISDILMLALESMSDGFGIIDQQGNLVYINPAALKLHGADPVRKSEYLGHSWLNLYSERGREQIVRDMMPAVKAHGYWAMKTAVELPDGRITFMDISATLMENGYMIGTMRDISAQVRTERERDIVQREYYQTQKMEAIGRMAGGVAHDFNNIFASAGGYAEFLIQDLDKKSKQHYFARQIMESLNYARDVVGRISQASRYNERILSRVDLVTILQDLMDEKSDFQAVSFNTNLDVLPARVESARFKKIIFEIVRNAVDAIGKNGKVHVCLVRGKIADDAVSRMMISDLPPVNYVPKITLVPGRSKGNFLMAGLLSRGQEYAIIEVEDSGGGMSAQVMERIFEPFFTTKSSLDKSGLGLSTALSFCAAHQSAITISSREGHGTILRLYIPITDSGAYHGQADGEPVANPVILLVEDDPDVSEVLCEMIERMKYEVVACSNAITALDVLRENPGQFSLIITDYMMPQSSGSDFIRRLKVEFPALPVLMMSGYSPEKLEDVMQENPAVRGFLQKPIESENLQASIKAAIEK